MSLAHARANRIIVKKPDRPITRDDSVEFFGRREWKAHEDEAIRKGHAMFYKCSDLWVRMNYYYHDLFLENLRTPKDLRARWRTISAEGYEDRQRLQEAMAKRREVSEREKRVHRYSHANRKPLWTEQEKDALKAGLLKYPYGTTRRFCKILMDEAFASTFLPCRDSNELKEHAKNVE
jgi:hypothetical protein